MRKSMVEWSALAAMLLGAAVTVGQQPAATPPKTEAPPNKEQPAKSKLEEILEKALKDNPDVQLAAAKVAEAEAELRRARLQVVQKVATAYQAVQAQQAAVDSAAAELAEMKAAGAAVDKASLRTADQKLIDAKAKLAQLEAELPYLLGKDPTVSAAFAPDGSRLAVQEGDLTKIWDVRDSKAELLRRYYLDLYGRLPTKDEMKAALDAKVVVQGPTADRIRAALDKPFSYEAQGRTMSDVIKEMNDAFLGSTQGLVIKDAAHDVTDGNGVSVHFDRMPLGAALEWVEDTLPNYRFYVRDYGLVFAARDQAPPGAPLLHDFWKGQKADDKDATNPVKGQPGKLSEGVVKEVNKDGSIIVSLGRNDGLAKGDSLDVIRQEDPNGRALLLGTVRVVQVSDGEAIAQPLGDVKPIQPGDHVHRISSSNQQIK
ncbi:MAG TPA: hypothetical protein VMS17_26045 [Gemmataceae bacterium]|nr:hypothetical protein [Gemmataceae bacterium]